MGPLTTKTLETCIPAFSKSLAEALAKSASKKVQEGWNKAKVNWGNAFERYLQKAQERNSKMKTLLYRHEPKPLYDFYEFADLRRKGKLVHTRYVGDVLALGHNLIITGSGGMGKTVMLKHFFMDSIFSYEHNNHVPVLVELRGLNTQKPENVDVLGAIYATMQQYGFKLARQYFDYSMEKGCYLILLDAFDELKEELRAEVTAQIQEMANRYPENYIILSSRPDNGGFVGWQNFLELESQPLSKRQATSLVRKIDTKYYEKDKKQGFLQELRGGLYEQYESFVSCPLLLTIMFLVYKNASSLPTQLVDFYEQAFYTLFQEHDGMKAGNFKREFKCRELGYSQFKDLFAHFCFKSYLDDEFEFTHAELISRLQESKSRTNFAGLWTENDFLEDLLSAVCMLVKDGLVYRFSHRSFQEYFAAYHTTKLNDEQQKHVLSFISNQVEWLSIFNSMQKERFEENFVYPFYKKINSDCRNIGPNALYQLLFQNYPELQKALTDGIDYSQSYACRHGYGSPIGGMDIKEALKNDQLNHCNGEAFLLLFLHLNCKASLAFDLLGIMTQEKFSEIIQESYRWLSNYESREMAAEGNPQKLLKEL